MALAPLVYTLWNRVMQTCLTSSISVEQPSALNSAPWGVHFSGYHKNMGGTLAPKALPSRLGQWRGLLTSRCLYSA